MEQEHKEFLDDLRRSGKTHGQVTKYTSHFSKADLYLNFTDSAD